jgi:hypothetical protein
MTLTKQIEESSVAGAKILPPVLSGIALGIALSIIPIVFITIGLKFTDRLFTKVIE